jgi:hypothetical protein
MGFGFGRGCFGREGVQSCTGTFPETGGSRRSSEGRIVSLRGEQGVNGLDTSGVARFKPSGNDRTRVMIGLQPKDLQGHQCRLGERVRVDL